MELQMRAERERRAAVTNAEASKRAAILESEGQKEAQIRKAEGEKGAAILRAEGLATARLAMADAEAEAMKRIAASLPPGEAATYLLGLRYIDALPQVAQGKGTTVFLPTEAIGVLGAVGGIKELLRAGGGLAAAAKEKAVVPGIGPFSGPGEGA
jgi:regulator of protease activity HflC (stomatin/prohibitin superfamily)